MSNFISKFDFTKELVENINTGCYIKINNYLEAQDIVYRLRDEAKLDLHNTYHLFSLHIRIFSKFPAYIYRKYQDYQLEDTWRHECLGITYNPSSRRIKNYYEYYGGKEFLIPVDGDYELNKYKTGNTLADFCLNYLRDGKEIRIGDNDELHEIYELLSISGIKWRTGAKLYTVEPERYPIYLSRTHYTNIQTRVYDTDWLCFSYSTSSFYDFCDLKRKAINIDNEKAKELERMSNTIVSSFPLKRLCQEYAKNSNSASVCCNMRSEYLRQNKNNFYFEDIDESDIKNLRPYLQCDILAIYEYLAVTNKSPLADWFFKYIGVFCPKEVNDDYIALRESPITVESANKIFNNMLCKSISPFRQRGIIATCFNYIK